MVSEVFFHVSDSSCPPVMYHPTTMGRVMPKIDSICNKNLEFNWFESNADLLEGVNRLSFFFELGKNKETHGLPIQLKDLFVLSRVKKYRSKTLKAWGIREREKGKRGLKEKTLQE